MKQPIPFGKYYLLERVNVGGMAEVFKAKATGVEGFERLIAVKRILPNIAEDEEFITMFIDEAKLAVQLTHANITQIFDLGKVDDRYFIALEYVRGKDLRAVFNRCRTRGEPVPIPLVCYAITKVCEGLDYAHQKRDSSGQQLSLVHRDVSPQNLIVSYEGEVKIIDFGIAKAAGQVARTQAGILKGKFGYMSPEQVEGIAIDPRSDIFGLGICLYELLTGERLFTAESDFATLEKVKRAEITPPSSRNTRISPELELIVLKALAKDREQRHQTAMELHDDLQVYLYRSGAAFGRKELAAFMQRLFAEEIEREDARDRSYAELAVEEDMAELSAHDRGGSPVENLPEADGRAAYAEPGGSRKPTLLGLSASPPRPPSVPPVSPRPASVPSLSRGESGVELELDWDEEELATEVFDRPQGDTPQSDAAMADRPGAAGERPSSPAEPAVADRDLSGEPLPYDDEGSLVLEAEELSEGYPLSLYDSGRQPAHRAPSQRRTMAIAVLVVAAIVSVIVAGLSVFQGSGPTGLIEVQTIPSEATVTLDGTPIPGRSPLSVEDVTPGRTHVIVVSHPGYQDWSTKVQLQPGQTISLPEVVLQPAETGVTLGSLPAGARIFVDGEEVSATTPAALTDLSPGLHAIRLEHEGYEPWESTAHVAAGVVFPMPDVVLVPAPAAGKGPTHQVQAVGPGREAPRRRRSNQMEGMRGGEPKDTESKDTESKDTERENEGPSDSSPSPAETPASSGRDAPAGAPPTPEPPEQDVRSLDSWLATAADPPEANPIPPAPAGDGPPVPESSVPGAPDRELPPEPAPPPGRPLDDEAQAEPPESPTAGEQEETDKAPSGLGYLRVNSTPWSTVVVDGQEIGPTPQMRIPLTGGTHEVKLTNTEFGLQKVFEVDVTPGETVTRAMRFDR